jgi:hypothetical protein
VNAVCLGLKSNANELDSCMTRGQILLSFARCLHFPWTKNH